MTLHPVGWYDRRINICGHTEGNMSKYPTTPEEKEWISATKVGNGAAFSHIIEKYQQPVYNLCYYMLRNTVEAEDATQEVFLRAYSKIDSYNENHKFSTWLFSIASHYCIDRLKRPQVNLVPWEKLAFGLADKDFQPELTLIKNETTIEIHNLIDTLPPDYRSAVILKYWYAMPLQDIAETLNSTVSAIKSKLFRARKMMAQTAMRKQTVVSSPLVDGALTFAT
jgi:RNA polymerase sigma-70 factor (ECF subfamily)